MRKVLILIITGLLLSVIPVNIQADTYINPEIAGNTRFVNTTGSGGAFISIQDAIDNSSTGDIIYIFNGIYFEFINISTPGITIIGENNESCIIDGMGSGNVIRINASYISISHLSIRNASSLSSLIYLDGLNSEYEYAEYATIENNIFYGENISNGITLESVPGVIIENNTFLNCYPSGIDTIEYDIMFPSGLGYISNNTFFQCSSSLTIASPYNQVINNSILESDVSLSCDHNIIEMNSFENCSIEIHGGLFIWTWQTVSDNTVNGKPQYYYNSINGGIVPTDAGQVIFAGSSNFIVNGLNISAAIDGILLGYSNNITISNNTLQKSNIRLIDSVSNDVHNNTIVDGTILVEGESLYSKIQDNIISNSSIGIELFSASYNIIKRNSISNCTKGVYITVGKWNTIEENVIISSSNNGIEFMGGANNTVINNNITQSANYCIYLSFFSFDNTVYRNNFINNIGGLSQAYDGEGNNKWNSSIGEGNYWSDWTSPDSDSNGIVDNPYVIDGTAGAMDYYPLANPVDITLELKKPPVWPIFMFGIILIAFLSRKRF